VPDLELEAQKAHFFNQKIGVYEVCLPWAMGCSSKMTGGGVIGSLPTRNLDTPQKCQQQRLLVTAVTSCAATFRSDRALLAPHPKSMVPIAPVAPHGGTNAVGTALVDGRSSPPDPHLET